VEQRLVQQGADSLLGAEGALGPGQDIDPANLQLAGSLFEFMGLGRGGREGSSCRPVSVWVLGHMPQVSLVDTCWCMLVDRTRRPAELLTSVHRSSCSSTTLPKKPSPPVSRTVLPWYCCLTDRLPAAAAGAACSLRLLLRSMVAQLQLVDRACMRTACRKFDRVRGYY
jgi:hypothetical protein